MPGSLKNSLIYVALYVVHFSEDPEKNNFIWRYIKYKSYVYS